MPSSDLYKATPQPVFQPRKRHSTVLGVCTNHWPKLIAVAVAGIALFFAVGAIEHEVESELSFSGYASLKEDYLDAHDAAVKASTKGESSLSDAEAQDYLFAVENGIGPTMTDEQVTAIVPTSHIVSEPVVSPIERLLAFIVVPVALTYGWFVEVGHGYSVRSTAFKIAAHLRRQRVHVRRRSYICRW